VTPGDGLGLGLGDGLGDALGEGLGLGEGDGDGLGLGEGVGVGEIVGLGDALGLGVGVGDGEPPAPFRLVTVNVKNTASSTKLLSGPTPLTASTVSPAASTTLVNEGAHVVPSVASRLPPTDTPL